MTPPGYKGQKQSCLKERYKKKSSPKREDIRLPSLDRNLKFLKMNDFFWSYRLLLQKRMLTYHNTQLIIVINI